MIWPLCVSFVILLEEIKSSVSLCFLCLGYEPCCSFSSAYCCVSFTVMLYLSPVCCFFFPVPFQYPKCHLFYFTRANNCLEFFQTWTTFVVIVGINLVCKFTKQKLMPFSESFFFHLEANIFMPSRFLKMTS